VLRGIDIFAINSFAKMKCKDEVQRRKKSLEITKTNGTRYRFSKRIILGRIIYEKKDIDLIYIAVMLGDVTLFMPPEYI
jgi:hypothetical protein